MLALQRTAGNAAVTRAIAAHALLQRGNGKKKGVVAEEEKGSVQGEHIFNALGDLALEMHGVIQAALPDGSIEPPELGVLFTRATALLAARNHEVFRAAWHGDPRNAGGYSGFVRAMRAAVPALLDGPSLTGLATLNNLCTNVDSVCVDETARQSRRSDFANPRDRTAFDDWFATTLALMQETCRAIWDATFAASRQTRVHPRK